MKTGESTPDLQFVRETNPRFPEVPELGPDGYTKLILAAWRQQTDEDRERYVKDERNRPVKAWFILDGLK